MCEIENTDLFEEYFGVNNYERKGNTMKKIASTVAAIILLVGVGNATPSTQIWNPSTDIQGTGTVHFGIDNYFTQQGTAVGGYAFPSDIGLTYGVLPGVEIGVDVFLPQNSPLVFNAKFAVPESSVLPAFAIGGFGFGTETGVTDQNVLYAVAAKTFMVGRVSAGYFSGNDKVLGAGENAGVILAWDKAVSDKIWLCVDYAGTKSALGSLFYGASYVFSPNTSVIFGYGTYNNVAKPTFTTQLDINI